MTQIRLFFFLVSLICLSGNQAVAGELEVRFAGQQTVAGENAIAVTFSQSLDPKQDIASYFLITTKNGQAVDGAWMLAEDPQVVYFTQIDPG